jgi:hypothetical protein
MVAIIHVLITTITIAITIIVTVGTIVRDKIRIDHKTITGMVKIAATIIMTIRESGRNSPKEQLLNPIDRKTDRISNPKEPILNPTDKRTDPIKHPNGEMPDVLGEIMAEQIRNLRAIGNSLHNAQLKAENRLQDALGQTMEIPLSNRGKEFNLALLTMTTGNHAPIGNNSALRNHPKDLPNAPMKVKTDQSDAAEIK